MSYRLLITGGRSQIAQAIAKRQLALGRKVIVTVSDADEIEKLTKEYAEMELAVEVVHFTLDPSVPYSAGLKRVIENGIEGLVLNAAPPIKRFRYVHQLPKEEVEQQMSLNILGNLRLVQAVLTHMMHKKFGRLVFVSSAMVQQAASRHAMYSMTKSAMESIFVTMAIEYGARNILSNIVRPGITKTERTKRFWGKEKYLERAEKMIPAGKLGTAAQVAEAFDPLLSESCYMNASTVTVAGGLPIISLSGMS
jgi:3-oxoacyl-[acyl-carrier protein] reductase